MAANEKTPLASLRIDKWLWCARFFKTRSLATQAIHGGHVKLNGYTVKPARDLRVGDVLDIAIGEVKWTVAVRGLNDQRRPASEAQPLYAETPDTSARRQAVKETHKFSPNPGSVLRGLPTRNARRHIRGVNESF